MTWLTVSTAACGLAAAQVPARALRDHEIHQHRHDEECEAARQRDQPEAVRVAGQQVADERQERERARQHDLVDRAIGAPMLRRHQLGGDRERRRDRKAETDAGQQADDDQLLGGLHQRDQQREEGADDRRRSG